MINFGKPRDNIKGFISIKELPDCQKTGFYEMVITSASIKDGVSKKTGKTFQKFNLGLAIMQNEEPVERVYFSDFLNKSSQVLQDICWFAGLVDKDGNCKVIDWMTAARGNRAVEYALMEFLFSEAELFPEASEAQRKFMSIIRGSIGKQFYKEYNRLTPISEVAVDRYHLLALILRRSWNIEFEKPYLTKRIRDLIALYCK